MKSLWYWFTELDKVYAHHAGRHGPNRLLPAEVLPVHGCVPRHAEPSTQDSGPDGRTAGRSAPKACTPIRLDMEEEHAMAHEAAHGSSDHGHGAVDRARPREEMHHLETSLPYWQTRSSHTPGPSDPGTPRHQIRHTIDLLRQQLGLKRAIKPP
jgi:hypothetical protein